MAEKNLSKIEKQRLKEKAKFEKEREQWKKKESKSRSKKRRKKDLAPVIVKAVAIALAAVLVLGFGAMYASTYGIPERFLPALRVAGRTIRVPEYTIYFHNEYERHIEIAARHAQIAALFEAQGLEASTHHGLDPERNPFGQRATGVLDDDENERELYWEDFLREQVTRSLNSMFALYARARQAGITLTERQQAQLDEQLEDLREMARDNVMSVNAFLRRTLRPPGTTERLHRNMLTREFIIQNYIQHINEQFREGYSNAELRAVYEEDTAQFDFVDLRMFSFDRERLRAEEGEDDEDLAARQEEADRALHVEALAFMAGVTDEASFVAAAQAQIDAERDEDDDEAFDADSATLYRRFRRHFFDQNFILTDDEDEDADPVLLSDWIFEDGREAGDTTVFEGDDGFFAVMMLRPAYALELVDFSITTFDVRTPTPTGEEDEDLTAARIEAITDAHAEAEAFITRWEGTGRDAEAFQVLLRERMTAENYEWLSMDGGQPGLAQRMAPGAAGSDELDDWLFAQGRQADQIGIVPTFGQDGFVAAFNVVLLAQVHEGEYSWMEEVSAERQEADFEAYMEELTETYAARESRIGMWFSMRTASRLIDQQLLWEQMQRELQGAG